MQMITHKCIKSVCQNSYEDTDPDPYYCPTCKEESKRIAKELELKFSKEPRVQVVSELQQFDAIRKAKGVNFVNIRDLGINLNDL